MSSRSKTPSTLIVGANSLIGKALMLRYNLVGERVIGTTKRREYETDHCIYLDLSEDVEKWQCPSPVSIAIVCAGVTKIEECRYKPAESYNINVKGVYHLVKKLVEQGAFVVFLSTNQVFDGSSPFSLPDDLVSPATEYGRQKAEVERQIIRFEDSVAIVRFTKILSPTFSLFSKWSKMLREGKAIHPFSNMYMSPLSLSCAVDVLCLLGKRRLSGILQVSGNSDISYSDAALFGAKKLKVNPMLVKPIEALKPKDYKEHLQKHTTLNIDRLRAALGIEPPDVWWTLEKAFLEPQVLAGFQSNLVSISI
tara:strand:+ start:1564 stop:2490 length:927 start_codon:yes stop_codon:yes gene_type:complete